MTDFLHGLLFFGALFGIGCVVVVAGAKAAKVNREQPGFFPLLFVCAALLIVLVVAPQALPNILGTIALCIALGVGGMLAFCGAIYLIIRVVGALLDIRKQTRAAHH